MKLLGVGAVASTIGGTATASSAQSAQIDEVYGAPYSADESVPPGLVDHTVVVTINEGGAYDGFPVDPASQEMGGGEMTTTETATTESTETTTDTTTTETASTETATTTETATPESGDELPEFIFDPVGLAVNPNEVVEFRVGFGLHTVTSFHPKFSEPPIFTLPQRVPTEYGFTSPPVVDGDAWLYRFTEPGVYDLLCLPHLELGMVMRIVVSDGDEVPTDDYGPLEIPNAGTVLAAPELAPENIVSEGEVPWAGLSL
ncbi:hypothetical protein [Haloferax sp. DFSO60]|uniref:cupredoxin domain-containing protein n=1 Tax=Haloferax sp. DFSO60 TaxID=3388652 RepID=UPI00397B4C35